MINDKKLIEEVNKTLKGVRDSIFQLFETVEKVQNIVDQLAGMPSIEEEELDEVLEKIIDNGKHILFPFDDTNPWRKSYLEEEWQIPEVTCTTSNTLQDNFIKGFIGYKNGK